MNWTWSLICSFCVWYSVFCSHMYTVGAPNVVRLRIMFFSFMFYARLYGSKVTGLLFHSNDWIMLLFALRKKSEKLTLFIKWCCCVL